MANPYAGTPQEYGWSWGVMHGYTAPPQSASPPLVIAPELMDAFNEGILVGQRYAIEGFPIDPSCVDISEIHHESLHTTINNLHTLEIGIEVIGHLKHALSSAFVVLIELAVTLPTHFEDPGEALVQLTGQFTNQLQQMGLPSSMELVLGGGIDYNVQGCHLLLTPIFKSQAEARVAAIATGRPEWIVVRWRTDACGVFDIIDSNQE